MSVARAAFPSANGATNTSLGQRPRKIAPQLFRALKGRHNAPLSGAIRSLNPGGWDALSGLGSFVDAIPRALPWAGMDRRIAADLAIRLSRTITIAKLVETLKTASSKWLKTESPDLAAFSWQRGYGCFSVGPSDLEALKDYIDSQEEHHKTRTFQDEFRMFLKKYGVEYDEAYVWD